MLRTFVLLGVGLFVPLAHAGVRQLTLEQLCHEATLVVRGTVTAEQARWAGSMIVTDWTVVPSERLKGEGQGPITFTVPGGRIGGAEMRASEAPRFRVGEDVILFLRPGHGECDVYGWFRGKYTVVDGQIREKRDLSVTAFEKSIRDTLKQLAEKR